MIPNKVIHDLFDFIQTLGIETDAGTTSYSCAFLQVYEAVRELFHAYPVKEDQQ